MSAEEEPKAEENPQDSEEKEEVKAEDEGEEKEEKEKEEEKGDAELKDDDGQAEVEKEEKDEKEDQKKDDEEKKPKRKRNEKSKVSDDDKEEAKEEEKPKRKRNEKPKEDKETKEEEDEEDEDDEDGDEAKEEGTYWNVDPGAKRQRKSLEHFHPDAGRLKEDVAVPKGTGTPLKDIPNVVKFVRDHTISKSDPKDPLKILSKWIFNRIPQPKELKDNLLEFSGLALEDQKAEDNFKSKVEKRQVKELKEIMVCLALERHGTQKELAGRLFEFLKEPSKSACKGKAPPGKAKPAAKKRTSSGKSKGKAKTPAKKSGGKAKGKDDEEDEDEDDDDAEEEEEEEEEEEAPPPKKQRGSPKKEAKKEVTKKEASKKEAKEEEEEGNDEDDSNDEDADEPLVKPKGNLKEHVQEVCSNADLSTLTLRMVREKLAEKYKVDTKKHKEEIRKLVDQYVKKHG